MKALKRVELKDHLKVAPMAVERVSRTAALKEKCLVDQRES